MIHTPHSYQQYTVTSITAIVTIPYNKTHMNITITVQNISSTHTTKHHNNILHQYYNPWTPLHLTLSTHHHHHHLPAVHPLTIPVIMEDDNYLNPYTSERESRNLRWSGGYHHLSSSTRSLLSILLFLSYHSYSTHSSLQPCPSPTVASFYFPFHLPFLSCTPYLSYRGRSILQLLCEHLEPSTILHYILSFKPASYVTRLCC